MHVLDCATIDPGRDPIDDLDAIENELALYGGLDDRPRLVALNKIDVPDARELAEMVKPILEERGYQVFEISAATHEGLRPLSFAMAELVLAARKAAAPDETVRPVDHAARPSTTPGFTVTVEAEGFRVRGDRPERWVRQTDFSNDEAVGYLADRLARLGVEEQLIETGRRRRRDRDDRRRRRRRLRLVPDDPRRRGAACRSARHRRPAGGAARRARRAATS